MNPSCSFGRSLLLWRPRYWLPARVASWGLDPMALRMRMSWVLSIALLVAWVVTAFLFQDRFTQPGQEDKFLSFIGLGGALFLTVGILLPSVLIDAFTFHRWLLLSGPVPLPSWSTNTVDSFLRRQPQAGPILLEWLVCQGLEYPHIAHAQKLNEVDWKSVQLLESPSPAWELEQVVELARVRCKAEDLAHALPHPADAQSPVRPRL